jgi:phenylalanine-4-hydroxylase
MVEPPTAPAHSPAGLRGDYSAAATDYSVEQEWTRYRADEHALWELLYRRQIELIEAYAAPEFLAGVRALGAASLGIPRFEDANKVLEATTGWRIVAVPGLIPEQHFFEHLAHQRFPVTVWLRRAEEIDYLVEPDIFHDFFGHVPLLTNPVFARFMQAYGEAGAKALTRAGGLRMLARLYWYMVEFGLIRSRGGLRVYGAGILSSKGETVYSIESPQPRRLAFELLRVMRTDYRIDTFQQTYFVLESFDQLFDACFHNDFAPIYEQFGAQPPIAADGVVKGDLAA